MKQVLKQDLETYQLEPNAVVGTLALLTGYPSPHSFKPCLVELPKWLL